MQHGLDLVILNAFLYCTWALYYFLKKGVSIVTFPMFLWAGASLANIYYFTSEWRNHILHDEIALLPYLYLFALVWIAFIPLIKFDYKLIREVTVNPLFFKYVSIVIIALSLVTITKNISYFLSHMIDPTAFLDAYEDKQMGVSIHTGLTLSVMNILKHMKGLIPVFFITSLTSFVKVGNWIKIGLAIALFNLFLNYLNESARFGLLTDLFLIVFVFFLMHPFISKRIRKVVNLFGIAVFVILVGGIILITMSRFGDVGGDNYVLYSLSLYFGESFSNFNGDLWNITSFTEGNNCFKYFINRFFEDGSPARDVDMLERMTHRRMYVFYTFVGDYFVDFGAFVAALMVIGTSWLFTLLTKPGTVISFGKLLLLFIYVKILLVGYTYWTYLNSSMEFVITIVLGLVFNISYFPKRLNSEYDFNSNGHL